MSAQKFFLIDLRRLEFFEQQGITVLFTRWPCKNFIAFSFIRVFVVILCLCFFFFADIHFSCTTFMSLAVHSSIISWQFFLTRFFCPRSDVYPNKSDGNFTYIFGAKTDFFLFLQIIFETFFMEPAFGKPGEKSCNLLLAVKFWHKCWREKVNFVSYSISDSHK